ncbi:MAG TPA: hypothetical protein ENK27_13355 [Desulfobulbus sp.]|nr:hypothetical protein [Desulfobulbus sp.]
MATAITERINLAGLQGFVMQRLRSDGGFAATPMQPHTIQDTYFAVSILRYLATLGLDDLSASLATGATGSYLRDYARRHPAMPVKTAFQLQRLAHHLDLDLEIHWRPGWGERVPDYEERWYEAVLKGGRAADPGRFAPRRRTVKELCHYLRLQQVLSPGRLPAEAEEMIQWLRRCQAPDGGFGFFPGTTSYIENSHYALVALALLRSHAPHQDRAEKFIVSCQTASGGFSRNSKAAPFLDASWHAVQAIRSLAPSTSFSSASRR